MTKKTSQNQDPPRNPKNKCLEQKKHRQEAPKKGQPSAQKIGSQNQEPVV
jgi:hypothetical protein